MKNSDHLRPVRWLVLTAVLFGSGFIAAAEEARRHGMTRGSGQALMAWDSQKAQWVTPVAFWGAWAADHGGLRFGRRSDYPEYATVAERDLMIIELDSGPCLMEFWHRRWRRAQDVRRWSPAFNDFGGCPNVFD